MGVHRAALRSHDALCLCGLDDEVCGHCGESNAHRVLEPVPRYHGARKESAGLPEVHQNFYRGLSARNACTRCSRYLEPPCRWPRIRQERLCRPSVWCSRFQRPVGHLNEQPGGAWDNSKKYISAGGLGKEFLKGSEAHKNSVTGDTVGDPLKDTSGPALNIVMKLTAILSLVLAAPLRLIPMPT